MDASTVSYPLAEYPRLVRERLAEGRMMVAIVDPVRWGNVERDLIQVSNQWKLLYHGNNVRAYYTVMPYAVHLRNEDGFFAEFVRRTGRECGIVAEITDADAFDASKFARLLMHLPGCVTPDGENGFLRYYDPSVLVAFTGCAGPTQLARLYGPYISAFWCEDAWRGIAFRLPRPENLPEPAPGPFRLSPDQFEVLLEAQYEKYAQAVEGKIRHEFYPGEEVPSPELYRRIRTALEAGEQYSYVSRSEGYQFVRAAAQYGWDFYEGEAFQALLLDPGLSRLQKLEALSGPQGKIA